MDVPPTRAEGLARLERFAPLAGAAYAATRNEDRGRERRDNVSTLSPYIRHRLVCEREALAAAIGRHGYEGAQKFVEEVLWRTYWKGWLEQRPAMWARYRAALAVDLAALDRDLGLRRRYEEAAAGETGIEGFDDWARELAEVGYLHNHARMWFSSIWIFTLRLPWTLGADLFLRRLIDGDPASNTLSWRWTGGLHTPGKTYLARSENIARYTLGRYAPRGLSPTAEPLADAPPPAPRPIAPATPAPEGDVALLLTEEDLTPEQWDLGRARVRAVLHGDAVAGRSPLPVSERVVAFTRGARADAADRAQARFQAPARPVALESGALVEAAREAGVRTLVTAHPPVGPAADALVGAQRALAEAGIGVRRVMRAFDARAWPHAERGFFAFRKRIPDILAAEGLV